MEDLRCRVILSERVDIDLSLYIMWSMLSQCSPSLRLMVLGGIMNASGDLCESSVWFWTTDQTWVQMVAGCWLLNQVPTLPTWHSRQAQGKCYVFKCV